MRVLTVDLEEWFHILDHDSVADPSSWDDLESRVATQTAALLDLFDRFNIVATFFCLGWVADRYPLLIREIVRRGHEIGTHSYSHGLVYQQSPQQFETDLVRSLNSIEQACGIRPVMYRAPGFSVTRYQGWVFELLAKHGITIDCSIFPAKRAHGGVSDFPTARPFKLKVEGNLEILCLPMSALNFMGVRIPYSGGGYFRLLPAFMLEYWFARQPYVMTYFHPRDFDPNQPRVTGLGPFRRFKSYVGLSGALSKLERLMKGATFCSVTTALDAIRDTELETLNLADAFEINDD